MVQNICKILTPSALDTVEWPWRSQVILSCFVTNPKPSAVLTTSFVSSLYTPLPLTRNALKTHLHQSIRKTFLSSQKIVQNPDCTPRRRNFMGNKVRLSRNGITMTIPISFHAGSGYWRRRRCDQRGSRRTSVPGWRVRSSHWVSRQFFQPNEKKNSRTLRLVAKIWRVNKVKAKNWKTGVQAQLYLWDL